MRRSALRSTEVGYHAINAVAVLFELIEGKVVAEPADK